MSKIMNIQVPEMTMETTISRNALLHIAKWVLFKTTAVCSGLEDSEESRDRHWRNRTMKERRLFLLGLARGLSEVGIEIEERRVGKPASEDSAL